MKKDEIRVGQIFEVVKDDFYGSIDNRGRNIKDSKNKRTPRYHIEKGEFIEIRFPFEWNYRIAKDDVYMSSDPDYILSKCKLYGRVLPHVFSANKANLEEILRLDLYEPVK